MIKNEADRQLPHAAQTIGLFLGASVLSAGALSGYHVSQGTPIMSPSIEGGASQVKDMNVITVLVDDMDDFDCADTKKFLPKASKYLQRQGTCYEDATVDSPVCCPARAAYMTGQMSHNNNVRTIEDGLKIDVRDTIQYQLDAAGLVTYGIGKYLNGVTEKKLGGPDYDRGFTMDDLWKPDRYLDYDIVSDAGEVVTPEKRVHTTVRTGKGLNAFIASMLQQDKQFYAYGAFMAPHAQHAINHDPSTELPLPTKANRDADVPPLNYRPEHNTADKLPVFRRADNDREHYEISHIARVRSLFDVDDQMADMFQVLQTYDALDTTMVVFTSDNGYQLGQNNWEFKGTPYPGSLNVPLLAYLPGTFAAGQIDQRPVSLLDVTATVYDVLDVDPTNVADGHSLLTDYRRRVQYHELATSSGGDKIEKVDKIPSWSQYKENGMTYIQYYKRNGELLRQEFYGKGDEGDMRNLLYKEYKNEAPNPSVLHHYRSELERLRSCSGTLNSDASNPCP